MPRARLIVILLVAILMAVGGWFFFGGASGPSYQGRPVSYWSKEYFQPTSTSELALS